MNIPIYRARRIDSDEYVEGNLIEDEGVFYIIKNPVITHFNGLQILTGEYEYLHRIDPTSLAMHFPNMLDSQGNKIFASLQDDGKGGDILKGQVYGISKGKVWDMVAEYKDTSIWLTRYINNNPHISMPLVYQKNGYRDMKVIGIKE